MSFDLGVFYTATPISDEEALQRYCAYCDGGEGENDLAPYIEPSPKIADFLKELTAEYPQIDDWPEETLDECPWNVAFDISEGYIVIAIGWPYAEEMYGKIVKLTEKHGLVCVDPQAGKIAYAPQYLLRKTKA